MHKFLFLAILVVAFSSQAIGAPKSVKIEKAPCDGDFEITVSVAPVDPHPAVGSPQDTKMTLKLVVDKDPTRSVGSRIHSGDADSGPFGSKLCQVWQLRYWNLLSRLFVENDRPERGTMVCHNVGTVDYRLGKYRKSTKFCLGDSQNDNMTYAFQTFYEGTDLLISR